MAKIECVACKYPYKYSSRTAIKTLVYKKGDTRNIEYLEDRHVATATRDMYNIDVKCSLCGNLNNHFNVDSVFEEEMMEPYELKLYGWSCKKVRKYKKKIIPKKKKHKFLWFRF